MVGGAKVTEKENVNHGCAMRSGLTSRLNQGSRTSQSP